MVFGHFLGQALGHIDRNNGADALAGVAADEGQGHGTAGNDFEISFAGGAAGDALDAITQTVLAFHTGIQIIAAPGAQLVHGIVGQNLAQADAAAVMAVEGDAGFDGDRCEHDGILLKNVWIQISGKQMLKKI